MRRCIPLPSYSQPVTPSVSPVMLLPAVCNEDFYIMMIQCPIISFTYIINYIFLLLIANDIETNPGPECPCGSVEGTKNMFLNCSECNADWHLECVGLKELTEAPLRKLKTWKCSVCVTLPACTQKQIIEKLCPDTAKILQQMKEMEERLNLKIEDIKREQEVKSSWASLSKPDSLEAKVDDTNKIVKSLRKQNKKMSPEQIKEREERTIIVKKYMDSKIINSGHVNEQIYRAFPGVVIRNGRTTPGGSILLELDDKKTADRVKANWNKELYGGNDGVVNINRNPPAGIIKNVYKDTLDDETSEEDLIDEIKSSYPQSTVSLFKRNDKFTGTLKIEFSTEEEFERAMKNRVKIFEQRYIMEKYNYKPRIIICKYCQIFGHVARVCRSKLKGKPARCGKCAEFNHETKDCMKDQENYKCCHCEANHETGAKNCEMMKNKLEEIKERRQNGE